MARLNVKESDSVMTDFSRLEAYQVLPSPQTALQVVRGIRAAAVHPAPKEIPHKKRALETLHESKSRLKRFHSNKNEKNMYFRYFQLQIKECTPESCSHCTNACIPASRLAHPAIADPFALRAILVSASETHEEVTDLFRSWQICRRHGKPACKEEISSCEEDTPDPSWSGYNQRHHLKTSIIKHQSTS